MASHNAACWRFFQCPFLLFQAMDLNFYVVAMSLLAVGVIGFMKGAFGGGFAIIGIPLMALVMDPITAGSVLAPVFVAMDLFALRYWKPRTWSRPDLAWLVPGLLVGVAAGYVVLRRVDPKSLWF